jgi:hypothetical protein
MVYYKINHVDIIHDVNRTHEPYYAEVQVEVYRDIPGLHERVTPESVKTIHVHLSGPGLSKAREKIEKQLRLEKIVNNRGISPSFTCLPCQER